MTRPLRGLFVTGTDTGVGKTRVACALIRGLRERGIDACGMKPVETGVGPEGPIDAMALRAAAGATDALGDVCPQRFALPAAPSAAADAEGRRVDLGAVRAAFARLSARHDCVIAEGAGGLRVPLAVGTDMADLAGELDLPVLVVARARLGTINHTLLTIEALRARSLDLAGIVVSRADGALSDADERNLELLRQIVAPLWRGQIPHLEPGSPVPEGAIDFDGIAVAMRRG